MDSSTGMMQVPMANAQAKLGALQERFHGFEKQMEMETKHRKDNEESKLSSIRDAMMKLEKTLNSEIKRRVEANKALQGMFESQIATVQDQLQASVDSLNDRMGIVERDFSMEREKYIRDIEDKNAMVAKDVNNLQNAFENEKVDRKEREFLIAKKLGDHETRTQGKFEQEQNAREQKYQSLREELEESKRMREKGDEKFQTFILEEA